MKPTVILKKILVLLHDGFEPSSSTQLQLVSEPPVSLASRSVDYETNSHTEENSGTTVKDCNILLQSNLTEEDKLNVILNFAQYNPPSTYSYPTKSEYDKCRSFQHHYLQKYSWLGYSIQLDGCLCLPCCLFASKVQNFDQPYCNWTKFNDKVKAHSVCSVHIELVTSLLRINDLHRSIISF